MADEPIEIAHDQWGVLLWHEGWRTLELRWLPSTKNSNESDVRNTMAHFASESEQRKPTFLIVDTTEFHHRWDDGMMAWRNENIIPKYNAGGVSKFAFIAAPGFPGPTVEDGVEPAPDGPANFPTGWFKTRDRAYAWLAG